MLSSRIIIGWWVRKKNSWLRSIVRAYWTERHHEMELHMQSKKRVQASEGKQKKREPNVDIRQGKKYHSNKQRGWFLHKETEKYDQREGKKNTKTVNITCWRRIITTTIPKIKYDCTMYIIAHWILMLPHILVFHFISLDL